MENFDRQFFLLLPLTAGLSVMGVMSLMASRLAVSWRMAASGALVTVFYALTAPLVETTNPLVYPLSSLVATGTAIFLVRVVSARFLRRLLHPLVYGSLMLAFGSLGLVGAYLKHEEQFAAKSDREMESFRLSSYVPERVIIEKVHAVTDQGHPIPVSHPRTAHTAAEMSQLEQASPLALRWSQTTIKRQPADDDSNCHGWVFTGGRYIVPSQAVEQILHDNGYATVPSASPGDLIVYRDAAGGIIHTAIVRYVAPGRPPMVEGKWGWMGVYLHAADESCYRTKYAFYRSARDGDLLHGIDGSSPVRFTGAE